MEVQKSRFNTIASLYSAGCDWDEANISTGDHTE
jgi:hypothetical protein